MRKCIGLLLGACAVLLPSAMPLHGQAAGPHPLAGADESTPSRSHYFSWIDNTNEGATEHQTLANLDFFKWLHDEYGMDLDIYALDAGAIDAPGYYGRIDSARFEKQFPNGFGPIAAKAKSFGCRLGVWLGPDGFGETPQEEQARTDMLVKLCRDYNFHLFKVDAVCGQLRTEKQEAFVRMLKECRKYSPDLIVLNHRLNLGQGLPYVTTSLWAGEAYIDVWRGNEGTATHNRAVTIELGEPVDKPTGKPSRLLEDHGVCLSSSLDYWEDDLFLQALSRNLILAPELYGSPWFLRDDEFPKLARIYNLTRRYREILPQGMRPNDKAYGPNAVARGNPQTRIITLRNPTWNPVTYTVTMDEGIGLVGEGPYEARRLHPAEEILGQFKPGESVKVTVPAFRAYAMLVSSEPSRELGVAGCAYEVVREVPGKPAILKLLGMPGTSARITLPVQPRKFAKATLGGNPAAGLLAGEAREITFPGVALKQAWHRKLNDLKPVEVPADAGSLYEATCFAADNNAMEIRSILRSGPTRIPQVRASRNEFLGQKLLVERGVWDRYLFDNDPATFFRLTQDAIWQGALRIDMGKATPLHQLVLRNVDLRFNPKEIFVSADLKDWRAVATRAEPERPSEATVLKGSYSGTKEWETIQVNRITIDLPTGLGPLRYLKIPGKAINVGEAIGYANGVQLDRTAWRASNVFADYAKAPAQRAWSGSFRLDEAATGSYLVIPCHGKHGRDGAYAALRMDGRWIGAPQRAKAYPANPWETGNGHPDDNFSYFFPVTEDMLGVSIDAVVMQFESEGNPKIPLGEFSSEVWLTAYPIPYVSQQLVLEE
ncbi:MAG: hypothetical protein NTW21_14280 [Verrucomicrobia bacterium]|nr:hypothetical protein [Verrucomicrobiota bacterium]